MKYVRGAVLGVGLSIFLSFVSAISLSALSTIPTQFLTDAPLLVTAYQRDSNGLKFVQLFNDSNSPIDLSAWKLRNESGTLLDLGSGSQKWLAPKMHVIASLPGVVNGASLSINPLIFTANAKLFVIPPDNSGYKQTDYELKAAGTTIWRRSTTQTGYSSSTTSFTAFADQTLFDDGLYTPPTSPQVQIVEIYPYASDCTPHDMSVLCSDYVKLYNPTTQTITLDDYVLRTDSSSSNRTSANTFRLDGIEIPAGGFHAVWLTDDEARISLTNSSGYVWLEDSLGLASYEETMTRYESAGVNEQGFSWMKDATGEWMWTSTPQPLSGNVMTITQTVTSLSDCPEGKYRNPETNRCRSIEEAVNALATCPEGQSRNPDTNRCRSTATAASASLTPCKEGQERNPSTNRCRSIASAVAELLPCDEGYERNPATNRCRKVLANTAAIAGSSDSTKTNGLNATSLALGIAGAAVIGYGIFEWRHEIAGGARRLVGAIAGKK